MTCKFCDACGKQLPVRDSYQERKQKYSIKMFVKDPIAPDMVDHERYLKFCPECREKVENFLDDIQQERPSIVQAELIEE